MGANTRGRRLRALQLAARTDYDDTGQNAFLGASGRRTLNFVPAPETDSQATDPWFASITRLTIESPRPVPGVSCSAAPRKNGSNARRTSSGVMPFPLSDTINS